MRRPVVKMSTRPVRQSAKDALEKIKDILAWETCSESSEAFKAAAEKMELEFANAKRRRIALTTAHEDEDEEEDDEDDDEECESDSEDAGSAPSSADLYSDPGDSSEDDDSSLSEAKSTDGDDAEEVAIEVADSPVYEAS
jgi:hypothetical protein